MCCLIYAIKTIKHDFVIHYNSQGLSGRSKTPGFALGFQRFPWDLANVDEWKIIIIFDLSFIFFVSIEDTRYNYKDVLAQGYCATKPPIDGYVSAVRRNCGDSGAEAPPTCDSICSAGSPFATNITARFPDASLQAYFCFEGLWIMMDHPRLESNPGPGQPDAGLLNLVTISYGTDGCTATGSDCGPNYCCCMAYSI